MAALVQAWARDRHDCDKVLLIFSAYAYSEMST